MITPWKQKIETDKMKNKTTRKICFLRNTRGVLVELERALENYASQKTESLFNS